MIDITEIIDNGTNFPTTWKTLVRELLLKFEDGATYHHTNIAGCRPYTIDLTIKIDECVDEAEDKQLHKEAKKREANAILYNTVFCELLGIVASNDLLTDELKDNIKELGVELE